MQAIRLSRSISIAVFAIQLAFAGAATAQEWQWDSQAVHLAPQIGGGGLQLQTPFSESLRLRLGLATSRFDNYVEPTQRPTRFGGNAAPIAGALLDYHVSRWGLRFTGGALYTATEGDGNLLSGYGYADVNPASGLYDGAYIDRYDGYQGDHLLPYVGMGWGQAFGTEQRLQLKMDFGVAFQGVSDLDGTAAGTHLEGAPGSGLETHRLAEELGWEQQFQSLRYSFSAGVRYRF